MEIIYAEPYIYQAFSQGRMLLFVVCGCECGLLLTLSLRTIIGGGGSVYESPKRFLI